ncbi:hypothetical protein ACP0G4_25100 [Escherichia coli]|uniref:F4 family fimbrial subunit n=1 Tax=Escherichia coli TaxID=562 RepID=UPI003CFB0ED7
MKKTLIALAVAASAVSGSAIAALGGWAEDQAGNIEFGGTITRPAGEVKWLWAIGDGFDSFDNMTSDLIDGGKTLNISVNQDMPLLATKVKNPITEQLSGTGAIPKVTFSSFDSTPVNVNFIDASTGEMEIKVKNKDDGSVIGNISIPFEYGAGGSIKELNNNGKVNLYSVSTGGTGTLFEGLVKENIKTSPTKASKWSGVTVDDVYAAMNSVDGTNYSGPGSVDDGSWINMADLSNNNYTGNNRVRYFVYGAGIPSGTNLSVKFDKPVTETTEWQAPITVTVTYS